MSTVLNELFYYVGEKPPALNCGYYADDGTLLPAPLAGAALVACCRVDAATEFNVTCTNAGDGTFTVDWPTGTSAFAAAGTMRVDVRVTVGAYVWYLPRFSIPVISRDAA